MQIKRCHTQQTFLWRFSIRFPQSRFNVSIFLVSYESSGKFEFGKLSTNFFVFFFPTQKSETFIPSYNEFTQFSSLECIFIQFTTGLRLMARYSIFRNIFFFRLLTSQYNIEHQEYCRECCIYIKYSSIVL